MSKREYYHRTNEVIDYIDSHLDSSLRLEELSEISGFSKYHFHRIFKTIVGETLNNYIKRRKMEKAYKLASAQNVSLTEIAFQLGYNSSANFSRDFKLYHKMSARDIKREHEHDNSNHHASDNIGVAFVGVQDIKAMRVLYKRVMSGYEPLKIQPAFAELFEYAKRNNIAESISDVIGIGYDDPDYTPKEKCRYDACIGIQNDICVDVFPYNEKQLPKARYAIFEFEGEGEEFLAAWDFIFKNWLIESDYFPADSPHIERYLPTSKKNIFSAHLCLPIVKK